MIRNLLLRVKTLLDITDDSQDNKLILLIENALYQVKAFIHSENVDGLEAPICQLVAYLYTSGLDGATGASSGSSSTSEGGGGVTPVQGELKRESYPGGISWEYTTSADFVEKSSSSSRSSSSTASGDAATYFNTQIAPLLRGRRHLGTLTHPYVEESPERY